MELPEPNKRLLRLIDELSNGNVLDFSKKLKTISQQRLNRIFNIDTRTKKYPKIPSDVLGAIKENVPSVDIDWILTGNGQMLRAAHDTNIDIKMDLSTIVGDLYERIIILEAHVEVYGYKLTTSAVELSDLKDEIKVIAGKRLDEWRMRSLKK